MASTEVWRDFEQIRDTVSHRFTVDKLKAIISALNDECNAAISKTGKKQDLINRVVVYLNHLRTSRMDDKWQSARIIINQVRNTGSYTYQPSFLPTVGIAATYGQSGSSTFPISTIKTQAGYPQLHGGAASSSSVRYDPYAPPTTNGAIASSSTSAPSRSIGIPFKDSPFFVVEQAVSSIVECPESTGALDRRQQTLNFALNNDQLVKLKAPNSQYQLRLFCTSSLFYTSGARSNNYPCPIEFPPTCEVRVNNAPVTANLKGLKKKPGTAPPPDLAKYVRLTTQQNRVEMVYVNSTQPVQSKKYYLIVMLVETTSIERLVDNLKAKSRRSSHLIRQQMMLSHSDDDDIQAGPQKMSLKCPLSFTRVTTPCRSSKCVHPQCFDATSWLYMMEQTTTYLCPTCERVLDHKDLIIDGYFDEILRQTDENVEDVIVEADGEWHTADNKYGSQKWKSLHSVPTPAASPRRQPSCESKQINGGDHDKGKARNAEVFVLSDDDDDDEAAVKKELSPSSYRHSLDSSSHPGQSIRSQSNAIEEVIDLTLSDEDDPPPPSQTLKRKATVEMELPPIDSWKKLRPDKLDTPLPPLAQPQQPVVSPIYRNPQPNNLDIRTHNFDHNQRPAPSTLPNINGYAQSQGSGQLPYMSYSGRPSLTESRQLPPPPPLAGSYPLRGNPPPRWAGQ